MSAKTTPSPLTSEGADALASLIGTAGEVEEGSRGFMQPQSTVRRKRGRPSNEEKEKAKAEAQQAAPEATPQAIETKPACVMVFRITSSWLCRSAGSEKLALTEGEIDTLATSWGMVLDKHLPAIMAEYAMEINAAVVTGMVAARLHGVATELIAERKREAARKGPHAVPTTPSAT